MLCNINLIYLFLFKQFLNYNQLKVYKFVIN